MGVDTNAMGLAEVPTGIREGAGSEPTFIASVDRDGLAQLANEVQQAIREHQREMVGDGIWYNGGTGLILLATSFATFTPNLVSKDYSWIAQALTALATFLVALQRALNFGERWMFHRQMVSGYSTIADMIRFYPYVPTADQPKYLADIWRSLSLLRQREAAVPGIGTSMGPSQ